MRCALLFCVALAGCGSVTTADVDAGGGRLEAGNTGAAGAAAAPDATGAAGASADALEAAAGPCGGVAPWARGGVYGLGDRTQSDGNVYACRSAGFCGFSFDYQPGVGYRWQEAWTLVGPCP